MTRPDLLFVMLNIWIMAVWRHNRRFCIAASGAAFLLFFLSMAAEPTSDVHNDGRPKVECFYPEDGFEP